MAAEVELAKLAARCAELPPAKGNYLETDFIRNLLLTVLDFQMHGRAVENAIRHYDDNRREGVRTVDDLDNLLAANRDDKEGNTAVALFLWNNKHWTRVALLRRFTRFLRSSGVIDQPTLRDWAANSQYDRDFKGKVHGMGLAIYNWLVMRQGIETVKPDVHLHRFTHNVLGRALSDGEVVSCLEEVARRLSLRAYELDWQIWEFQRGGGLESWSPSINGQNDSVPASATPKQKFAALAEELPDDATDDDVWRAIRDRFPDAVETYLSTPLPGRRELKDWIRTL